MGIHAPAAMLDAALLKFYKNVRGFNLRQSGQPPYYDLPLDDGTRVLDHSNPTQKALAASWKVSDLGKSSAFLAVFVMNIRGTIIGCFLSIGWVD